jgi:hypothetical protein
MPVDRAMMRAPSGGLSMSPPLRKYSTLRPSPRPRSSTCCLNHSFTTDDTSPTSSYEWLGSVSRTRSLNNRMPKCASPTQCCYPVVLVE